MRKSANFLSFTLFGGKMEGNNNMMLRFPIIRKNPKAATLGLFRVVAGEGFEPTTSGL